MANKRENNRLCGVLMPIFSLPSDYGIGTFSEEAYRFVDFLEKEAGLMLNSGVHFGGSGKRFVRINLACPKAMVEDGMRRLQAGIRKLKA